MLIDALRPALEWSAKSRAQYPVGVGNGGRGGLRRKRNWWVGLSDAEILAKTEEFALFLGIPLTRRLMSTLGPFSASVLAKRFGSFSNAVELLGQGAYDSRKRIFKCENCGVYFQYFLSSPRKFCSPECRYLKWVGPGNPSWTGGSNTYGEGWQNTRERARSRDGFRCVDCGVTETELGSELDVHHLFKYKVTQSNELSGLVSVCGACHMTRERELERWMRERDDRGIPLLRRLAEEQQRTFGGSC